MAESYRDLSPYNYAMNDPIAKLDPNGMWVERARAWASNNPNPGAEMHILDALEEKERHEDEERKMRGEEGPSVVRGLGNGLKDLAKALVPIRFIEEGEPTTLGEVWDSFVKMPGAP